ncbi:aspartyl protease family protein At5g10770 isoform X2 [Jatropha curcas]|uniref:aspartyl protease family protein At5g10770 isoform X2 n=1 Tax=Jatropha curcas TaxID=180498 RepID=UPI0009D6E2F0|nr:aspartyl protease family protein At5g10770 isoform X2 [Jatropha curcas]
MADSYLSMATFHLLFYSILFSSCYLDKFSVYGANHQMKSLLPVSASLTSTNKGSKGQCQGLNCQEKSEPNSQKILLQDNYRFRSLKSIEVVNKYGEGIRLPLTLKGDDNFLTTEIKGNFGGANGLLGVGPGQFSLMAQTDTSYFSLFCYCLPATESSTGYIVFGVQAYETCQPDENKMIPIGPAPTDKSTLTSYSVKLTAITIGQQRLPMSSSLNAVIDSGTVITRLPPSLYSSLSSAFQGLMSQYPRAPRSPPLLDICYNLVGHTNWTPPNMVLQFEGLNVPLEPSAVTFRDKNDSQVCLAFARNVKEDDLIIIGNKQHRALNIFFDISNKNMAFGRGCSNI